MLSKLPSGSSHLHWTSLSILGLTTWLIYLVDRLLDIRIYPPKSSERHLFHFQNREALTYLLASLIGVSAAIFFFLPQQVMVFGLILSLGIVIYLIVLNRYLKSDKLQWLKEPITSLFYTLAVFGVAVVEMPVLHLSTWLIGLMFFLVVSQNLLLFSYFEYLQKKEIVNTVTYFGKRNSEKILRWVFAFILIVFITFFGLTFTYKSLVVAILLIMSMVLSLLPIFQQYLLINNRYRWVGDGVLAFAFISFLYA